MTSPAIIAAWVGALLALEWLAPLRIRKRPVAGRWLVNAGFTALVMAIGTLVVRVYALKAASWSVAGGYGIAWTLPLPDLARPVVCFLLMDLTFYWWHRANHEVAVLWRFHNVHHMDPDLDVSTSFRFHAVEVLYSTLFRAAQAALIGMTPATYAVYELVFTCGTAFHHGNMKLPVSLERVINLVFVTPRMHGIHHSGVHDETDSNYSVVFSWWDRMHNTLRLNVPHRDIDIGVPGYAKPGDNGFISLLAAPFAPQRAYWLSPVGARFETRGTADDPDRTRMTK